jgi:hypothetical protein
VLPAAPWADPEVAPEQPAAPTPFERPELPADAGPLPGVEPIVEGALVLEPLVPIEPELLLPELVPLDIPEEPVAGELPAAPPLLPALCAKAAPQANESTATDASKIRLMLKPPELMVRARASRDA